MTLAYIEGKMQYFARILSQLNMLPYRMWCVSNNESFGLLDSVNKCDDVVSQFSGIVQALLGLIVY